MSICGAGKRTIITSAASRVSATIARRLSHQGRTSAIAQRAAEPRARRCASKTLSGDLTEAAYATGCDMRVDDRTLAAIRL